MNKLTPADVAAIRAAFRKFGHCSDMRGFLAGHGLRICDHADALAAENGRLLQVVRWCTTEYDSRRSYGTDPDPMGTEMLGHIIDQFRAALAGRGSGT